MPRPSHGTLGTAFLCTRVLLLVSLLITLSVAAAIISALAHAAIQPMAPLIAILCACCFALLYCAITLLLYAAGHLPLLTAAAFDFLFAAALMAASIAVGTPRCAPAAAYVAPETTPVVPNVPDESARMFSFVNTVARRATQIPATVAYADWLGAGIAPGTCAKLRVVWGFGAALAVLLMFSSVLAALVWRVAEGKREAARRAEFKGEA